MTVTTRDSVYKLRRSHPGIDAFTVIGISNNYNKKREIGGRVYNKPQLGEHMFINGCGANDANILTAIVMKVVDED